MRAVMSQVRQSGTVTRDTPYQQKNECFGVSARTCMHGSDSADSTLGKAGQGWRNKKKDFSRTQCQRRALLCCASCSRRTMGTHSTSYTVRRACKVLNRDVFNHACMRSHQRIHIPPCPQCQRRGARPTPPQTDMSDWLVGVHACGDHALRLRLNAATFNEIHDGHLQLHK